MVQSTLSRATLLPIACTGLILLFCYSFLYPYGSGAATVSKAAPKPCVIDIAPGMSTGCKLNKANFDYIIWDNSSPTKPRSVHFLTSDTPFGPPSCWDVLPGTPPNNLPVLSGPISANAAKKSYTAYTADQACKDNPPSVKGEDNRDTPKVIIQ